MLILIYSVPVGFGPNLILEHFLVYTFNRAGTRQWVFGIL